MGKTPKRQQNEKSGMQINNSISGQNSPFYRSLPPTSASPVSLASLNTLE
jgi:hypothetical protein